MIHKNANKGYRIADYTGRKLIVDRFNDETDLPFITRKGSRGISKKNELTFLNYDDAERFLEWWRANRWSSVYIKGTGKTYDLIEIDLGNNLGKAYLDVRSLWEFMYLPDYIAKDLFADPDMYGYKNIIKRIANWIEQENGRALSLIAKSDFHELHNYLYFEIHEPFDHCNIFCNYLRYIDKNFK